MTSATHTAVLPPSAIATVLSWLAQATRFPLSEKETPCTQPAVPDDSNITSPNGILEPHGVGAGFSSTSLI